MFVWGRKDGGPESKVSMYGVEFKRLFSVLFLKFEKGSREAFHSHAFNSVSIVLTGGLTELIRFGDPAANDGCYLEARGWYPYSKVKTYRNTVHKVYGIEQTNWVLSLRGPWSRNWYELLGEGGQERIDLSIGRKRNERSE